MRVGSIRCGQSRGLSGLNCVATSFLTEMTSEGPHARLYRAPTATVNAVVKLSGERVTGGIVIVFRINPQSARTRCSTLTKIPLL